MQSLDQIGHAFLVAIGYLGAGIAGILFIILAMWLGIKFICAHDRQSDAKLADPPPLKPLMEYGQSPARTFGVATTTVVMKHQVVNLSHALLVQELLLDALGPLSELEILIATNQLGEGIGAKEISTILTGLQQEQKIIRTNESSPRWRPA